MSNAHLISHVTPPLLLQYYKIDVYICLPCHYTIATERKRSSAASDAPATRKKRIEDLEPTTFCTYWPNNLPFDPMRVLLRRLFFVNEVRTKYVYVGFYPARDYVPLVEIGVVRRGGGPKTHSQ